MVAVSACSQSSSQSSRTDPSSSQSAPNTPLPPNLEIKRLILTDGSYQPIKGLDVKGDRVRYLSSERDEWEEMPKSLVDWAATEKYAREAPARQFSVQVEHAKTAEDDDETQPDQLDEIRPAVAPGLRLPDTGGVFLLDVFNRQAQLVEISQKAAQAEQSGRNVKRATIDSSQPLKTIDLPGPHARVQSHVPNPFLYVDIDQEADAPGGKQSESAAVNPKDRFRIVRLDFDPKRKDRGLSNVKIAVLGKLSELDKFIPATVQEYSGYWLRIAPKDSLEPGEYALVEVLPDNLVNLYVWDFGVDPKAPANRDARVPEPGKEESTPVLNRRKPGN
ncbi:MAG: hypothetical protein ABSD20_13460 [Terriglobales bacterium]